MDRLTIETDAPPRLVVSSHPSMEQSRRRSALFAALLVATTLGGLSALGYFTVLALSDSTAGSLGALSIYGPILFTVGGLAVAAVRSSPRFRRLTVDDRRWTVETLAVRRLSTSAEVIDRIECPASEIRHRIEDDRQGRPYLAVFREDDAVAAFGDIAASRLSDDADIDAFRSELQTLRNRLPSH